MRFVVIGPGALGCLFAASLAGGHKHDVWILDHNRERAELLNRDGVILSTGDEEKFCPVRATVNPAEIPTADCYILCVKSHQVAAAISPQKEFLRTIPLTVAFQNGIGHLPLLSDLLPKGKWGVGVTSQGANLIGPNLVRHGGSGLTALGFTHPPHPDAEKALLHIASALSESGIATTTEPDIRKKIWQKLIINVGINALTAILNCTNGELLQTESSRQRMHRAVLEGMAVAEALGISFDQDPVAMTMQVCKDTGPNISSMLQDIRNKRRTEIDAINGAILKEGRRLGIDMPENTILVREIKNLENHYFPDST